MQVNVAGIRRNIKNLAHNYSDAQVKVREATSNDPWGPSASIMAEIADLTYNMLAFSEIMQMIWKRLNDHGRNWRHVYKALLLLEYLIKTGTEKVAQQCKENIFAIQTLKEFAYYEEGKDQGLHVREKAKHLVSLLRDDERLKNERTKALKAKERLAQNATGFGSDGYVEGPINREMPPGWHDSEPKNVSEMEFVRPQTAGEEELQLQLAMAMSREEAEQEEAKRRSDDVRLQLALSQSENDFKQDYDPKDDKPKRSHLVDLLDISVSDMNISSNYKGDPDENADPWSRTPSPPWGKNKFDSSSSALAGAAAIGGASGIQASSADAWSPRHTQSPSGASISSNEGWLQNSSTPTSGLNGNVANTAILDPWLPKQRSASISTPPVVDPWLGVDQHKTKPEIDDPWHPKVSQLVIQKPIDPWEATRNLESRPSPVGAITPLSDLDDFDVITNRNKTGQLNTSTNGANNNNSSLLDEMDPLSLKKQMKTPQSFLGENSSLVNLDNLIKPVIPNNIGPAAYNPFSDTTVAPSGIAPTKPNLFAQPVQTVPSINQLKQQPFPVTLNQDPWAPINSNTNNTTQLDDYIIDCDSDQITVFTNNAYYNPLTKCNNNNNNINNDNNNIYKTDNNNLSNKNNYNNIKNYCYNLKTSYNGNLKNNNNDRIDDNDDNSTFPTNSTHAIDDSSLFSFENINYFEQNNNNSSWTKPETTTSNPFLS